MGAVCLGCGKSHDKARTPAGWKPHGGGHRCPACWGAAYVLRAVTVPLARPDGGWPALDAKLAECWAESTALANWTLDTLYARDVRRTPNMAKLPPMPKVDLYNLGFAANGPRAYPRWAAWAGACAAASSLMRAVEAKYRSYRYELIWQGERTLDNVRYPYPFPVHNQCWSLGRDAGGRFVVTARLPGGPVELPLRGGPEFARQLCALRQLERGEAVKAEMALYRVSSCGHNGRHQTAERAPGGGRRKTFRPMCKMVLWVPRPQYQAADKTLFLATDPNAFWVAEVDGFRSIVNGDHVRRSAYAAGIRHRAGVHDAYRQRMSEDLKYEKRWPAATRRRMVESLAGRCEKHNRRVETFCKEVVAHLVGFARRRKVSAVVYDDADRGFVASFPWARLRTMLATKLDELGIELLAGATAPREGDADDADGGAADDAPGAARAPQGAS